MESGERKTWLPEHPEDFGNTQAEEMFRAFFAEQLAPIGTIEKTSKKEILNHPLAQLHDNAGNLVTSEKIPIVMIHDKIEKWGKAYNKYLKEKLQNPLEALENKTETKKRFLKQMIELLKAERYYYPQHQELFDARISILEHLLKNTR